MTSTTRTERLNRKLFSSIACGLLICCLSLLLIIDRNFTNTQLDAIPKSSISKRACYQRTSKQARHNNEYEIRYLVDVMEADPKPIAGESIIFHETTCSRSGLVHLNSRYFVNDTFLYTRLHYRIIISMPNCTDSLVPSNRQQNRIPNVTFLYYLPLQLGSEKTLQICQHPSNI